MAREAPVEEETGVERRESTHRRPAVQFVRVLMVAGGTGGHILPALAVAEELRARSAAGEEAEEPRYEVQFLGTSRGLEARLIPAAGFPLRTVNAAGLKGIGGWRKVRNLLVLPRSAIETAVNLGRFRPDVVVGLGGYVAGPAMLEAALVGIPTLLIEPNAIPGFTNRVLAPFVRVAAVGFEEAGASYKAKARVTGHAVRAAFFAVPPREHVPPFTILILGGSQGSAAINDCVVRSLPLFSKWAERPRFVHQTGERDYNSVRQGYQERGVPAEVVAFIDDVPGALARADLVISRAGANTVAELAAGGKAAVLIPFPGAADHHQLGNARALARVGGARIIEQRELTPEKLEAELRDLLGAPSRVKEMEKAARSLARRDAAARIADLIEKLVGKR